MNDRTATAIIHGFIAACVAVIPGKEEEKRFAIYNKAKEFARGYLRGEEIDTFLLDDLVQGTVELVNDEIEGVVSAEQQGFPNA